MAKKSFPEDYYEYDNFNYKKYIKQVPKDLSHGYVENPRNLLERIRGKEYKKVVMCGMGGSGIASDLLSLYLEEELEIISVKDYKLPSTVSDKDLVIISSYSGNTEEAISCYREARRLNATTLIVCSGGKLASYADQTNTPLIKLPQGYQPRAALAYSFTLFLRIFEELSLIKKKEKDVEEVVNYLGKQSFEKVAIDLSEKLVNKTPLIYTSTKYSPIGFRWKTQINENAKVLSFNSIIPELNHNEINGYVNTREGFHVIFLTFTNDFYRNKKRTEVTKKKITRRGITSTELEIKGNNLVNIFSAILLGDWLSYYLALRLETNPWPVDFIEDFKKDLGPFV